MDTQLMSRDQALSKVPVHLVRDVNNHLNNLEKKIKFQGFLTREVNGTFFLDCYNYKGMRFTIPCVLKRTPRYLLDEKGL